MIDSKKVIFLSYNGLLEPILTSQVIPYLEGLASAGWSFILITYEKKKDIERVGRDGISSLKSDLLFKGIDWRYLRYHKTPKILSTLFDIFAGAVYTFFVITRNKIKIVHVRGATPGAVMILLSGITHVKLLFDMRGRLAEEMAAGGLWREGGLAFRLVKRAEKRLLILADAVTVLTKKHLDLNRSLDYLSARNIPMDAIPCCVDMAKFYYNDNDDGLRKRLNLEGKFVLIYPGKLGTFYLVDEMLAFFKFMCGRLEQAVFLVLTPDDPASFERRASRAGVDTEKVRVVHNVPFEEMPRYMRLADAGIFFIKGYEKLGSSPIKMGEFLASGVPVIINPGVGDTEEIVRQNRVGVVVDKFSDKNYQEAVEELIRLKEDGESLKKRCRDTADRHLSLEDGIAKYARIYSILSEGAR